MAPLGREGDLHIAASAPAARRLLWGAAGPKTRPGTTGEHGKKCAKKAEGASWLNQLSEESFFTLLH